MNAGNSSPPEARIHRLEWEAEDRAKDAAEAHDDIVTLVKLQRDQQALQEKRWAETQAWLGLMTDQLYQTRLTLWFIALIYGVVTLLGKL